MPETDPQTIDLLLAAAGIGASPGRGAKIAPALGAQLATVALRASLLQMDTEAPGALLVLARERRPLARERRPK